MDGLSFECPRCRTRHVGLPALVYDDPATCVDEHGNERPFTRINDDFRIVEDEYFFVRTVFEIPIIGESQPLEWGVWGSLSKASFQLYWDSFSDADQSKLGVMFSYFGNHISGYPDSWGLHCDLLLRDGRQRPLLRLHQHQDHPLIHDQIHGITLDRAVELAMPVLHPQGEA